MSTLNRAFVFAASLVALSSLSGSASAFVREESNWNPGTLPIKYSINQSTAPPSIGASGAKSAVEAGFASWSAPSCTTWRTTDLGNTSSGASSSDSKNTILWVSGSWPAALGDVNSVIGVTTPVWTSGGYFIDADIQFNNVGFKWSLDGSSGTVDTQSIATHEEGHFLGLAHSPIGSAIMYASYSGGLKRSLSSDDISGVCAIYPSGGPVPDAGGTPDTGGGSGGALGSPCSSPSDCSSGVCVNDGTKSYCSETCSSDCDCPTSYQCYGTSSGSKVCGFGTNSCSTGGGDASTGGGLGGFGATCTSNTDCASNLCVATSSGATSGTCTRACSGDSTCPCGYQCFPTSESGLSVCAPGKHPCDDGGAPDAFTTEDGGATDDAGVPAGGDASTGDAGHVVNAVDDTASPAGCTCSTPSGSTSSGGLALSALVALAAVLGMRRRR